MRSVLIITNRFDPHVDHMIRKFNEREVPFMRFNTDEFPAPTSLEVEIGVGGIFSTLLRDSGRLVEKGSIGSVWYRRPEPFPVSSSDESIQEFAQQEMRELVRGWWASFEGRRWFNDPFAIDKARHKVFQLKEAAKLGFKLPRTLITCDPTSFVRFWEECGGNVIYKPLGRPTSRDEQGSQYYTPTCKLDASFLDNLDGLRIAPCIFQENVPKSFELRVTVIDRKVFACAIHSQEWDESKVDWRLHSEMDILRHTVYELPTQLERMCVDHVQEMGLLSGMIDLIVTPEGEYVFLENNPNGQWLWIEEHTGLPISDSLLGALVSY